MIGLALIAILLAIGIPSFAQDSVVKQLEAAGSYDSAVRASTEAPPPNGGPSQLQSLQAKADQLTHEYKMQQEANKIYEIVILSVLALLSLFLVLRFLTTRAGYSPTQVVNATGLICIIFGTILLVIMAQSDQQLTAAVGILGAVAGYLFRSMHVGEDAKGTGQEPRP
jgi:hypothetical protein